MIRAVKLWWIGRQIRYIDSLWLDAIHAENSAREKSAEASRRVAQLRLQAMQLAGVRFSV